MEEKHINVSKVIITIISALILVAIITALTIILTNKKQAAEVVAENPQAGVATKQDENVWKAKKNEPTNNTNTAIQNTDEQNISTQNTVGQNIAPQNTVIQNIIETNTIIHNSTPENLIQNNEEQNNIVNNNQSELQSKNEANNTEQKKSTDNKKSNNGVIWLTFDDGPSANILRSINALCLSFSKESIKNYLYLIIYKGYKNNQNEKIAENYSSVNVAKEFDRLVEKNFLR